MALVFIIGGWFFYSKNLRNNFTEEIKKDSEKNDLIRVFAPEPNTIIKNPIDIKGEARGYWFFEASFPVKIFDENNNQLGVGIAEAQSEWMTENFVPFKLVLNFKEPTTEKGFLVFEKDNPSGLREFDDELRIPINFR